MDSAILQYSAIINLVSLIIGIIIIASYWKMFIKAGQPGWAAIIPIYNIYIMLKLVGKPAWWIVLFFLPFINIVIAIMLIALIAKVFGKTPLFALGLFFLPFIFFPILGFGDAKYVGPLNSTQE